MNNSFYRLFFNEGLFSIPEKTKVFVEESNQSVKDENIEVEEDLLSPAIVTSIEIPFFGHNKKKILILNEEIDETFIGERDKDFLSKILGAVKLSFNDVALVNTVKYPGLTFDQLSDQLDPKIVLVFGKGTNDLLDNHLQKYKTTTRGDASILFADLLSEIQEDKAKKVLLWEELKTLFV